MASTTTYYKIYTLSTGIYKCLVICLSYESIFVYLEDMQNELQSKGILDGDILIDQLMITGNNKNRFLSLHMLDGIIDLTSARNVNAEQLYHQLTSSELRGNAPLLKNSILSSKQISMILGGCVV